MKFGICGYGNLGRSVEKLIVDGGEDELVGIFTRRKDIASESGVKVFQYEQAKEFENKIDVMIMCGGSQEDLIWQSPDMLQYFDIIDTFDTHAKISQHKQNLQKVAKKFKHSAIYSCGWDPGLFSMARVLFSNIFSVNPQTFWGRGVSQGHSEALRNIKGVKDAIQFTVPNEEILKKVLEEGFEPKEEGKHVRECHIALDGSRSFEEIKSQILNTENYFKGQRVVIYENSEEQIKQMKENMFHKGIVIGGDKHSKMTLNAQMNFNPLFTAQIVLTFAKALKKMPQGVYSVLDIPLAKIGRQDNQMFL